MIYLSYIAIEVFRHKKESKREKKLQENCKADLGLVTK